MTMRDHTDAWRRLRRLDFTAESHPGLLACARDAISGLVQWRRSRALACKVALLTRDLQAMTTRAEVAERDLSQARADLAAERLIKQQLLDTMTAPQSRRGRA